MNKRKNTKAKKPDQVIHGPFAARFGVPIDKKYYWETGLEMANVDEMYYPLYHSALASFVLRHYFDMEVEARTPWLIEPDNKDIKLYSPLAHPNLPHEFARLEPTQEAIKRFADRYGLLSHKVVLRHPTIKNKGWFGESLAFWKFELARMKLLRQLMVWVRRNDKDALSQHIIWEKGDIRRFLRTAVYLEWDSRRVLIGPVKQPGVAYIGKPRYRIAPELTDASAETSYYKWEYGDVIEPAREVVHREINAGLKDHVSPAILPDRPNEIFMLPDCLLSAMYVLLALEMTRGGRTPIKCKGCEEFFTPDHGRQTYCADSCRKNHWYHNHKNRT